MKRLDVVQQSELSAEAIQRIQDEVTELRELWENRFMGENPRFVERYIRGEVGVHVHFVHGGVRLCARFEKDSSFDLDTALVVNNARLLSAYRGDGCHQQSVFIGKVQFVDNVQGAVTQEPCVVWLQLLNQCFGAWANSLYLSREFGFVIVGTYSDALFENGKCNIALPETGNDRTATMSLPVQLIDQNVERRAKVMQNFSRDYTDREGYVLNRDYVNAVILGLNIVFESNFIRATLDELLNLNGEMLDVLVGPLNLRKARRKSGDVRHS